MTAKAFLPPGGRAVVPIPTYSMYRVVSEQRGATVALVPRRRRRRAGRSTSPAIAGRARDATLVWLCNPNNPTGLAEPRRRDRGAARGLAMTPPPAATPPAVAVDEAYAEFAGETVLPLRAEYPNLVVIRTASKAYGLAGPARRLRARPARDPRADRALPAPGLGRHDLDHDRRAGAARPGDPRRQVAARRDASATAWRRQWPRPAGAPAASVTNFILVDFGTPDRAEVAEGLLASRHRAPDVPVRAPARRVPAVHRAQPGGECAPVGGGPRLSGDRETTLAEDST